MQFKAKIPYIFLLGSYFLAIIASYSLTTALGSNSLQILGLFVLGTTIGSSISSTLESVPTQILIRFPELRKHLVFSFFKLKLEWYMGLQSLVLSTFLVAFSIVNVILHPSDLILSFSLGLTFSVLQLKLANSYLVLGSLWKPAYTLIFRFLCTSIFLLVTIFFVFLLENSFFSVRQCMQYSSFAFSLLNILPFFLMQKLRHANSGDFLGLGDFKSPEKSKYTKNLYWQLIANILSQNIDKWLIALVLNAATLGTYAYLVQLIQNPALLLGNAWSEKNYREIFDRRNFHDRYNGLWKFIVMTSLISLVGLVAVVIAIPMFGLDVAMNFIFYASAFLILIKTQIDILISRLSLSFLASYKSGHITVSYWVRVITVAFITTITFLIAPGAMNMFLLCLFFLLGSLLSSIVLQFSRSEF